MQYTAMYPRIALIICSLAIIPLLAGLITRHDTPPTQTSSPISRHSLPHPINAEPLNFDKYSSFCLALREEISSAMRFANQTPKINISELEQFVDERYDEPELRKVAFTTSVTVWLFAPITDGELQSNIMSIYDSCMSGFSECVQRGQCVNQ